MTPAIEREIDAYLAGEVVTFLGAYDGWLAAQRAEIAGLRERVENLKKSNARGYELLLEERERHRGTAADRSLLRGSLKETEAERDALLRVARAATTVTWGRTRRRELLDALAAPKVQALLASRPEARPEHRP